MRHSTFLLLLLATAGLLAGCGGAPGPSSPTAGGPNAAATPPAQTARTTNAPTGAGTPAAPPPITSAHGGGATAPAGSGVSEKPEMDTAALDAKIEKADAKAKAPGATDADKRAAAAALVERGRMYYDAGQPRLYKFALGDFRRALRYQPDNKEAREKMDTIVSIYQSMGRPVPDNGNEL